MTDRNYGVKLNLEGGGQFVTGVASSEAALAKMATTATATAGKVDQVGMSTRQMSAAMRGVPAQITDIVTSLQGGQAPLTVFLQQGGQLKDMFGGIAPAARALGSALVGMISPMSVGVATIAALGVAAYKGAQQQEALRDAVVLSGNAAGMTSGRFDALAASVAASSGQTIGGARDIAQALVASGKVGRDAFETVALAAARYADVSGQTASQAAQHFAGMSSGVAAWAAENNKSWNFITADVYRNIKALEDQGRVQAAMIVAGEAFIAHVAGQRKELGYLETAVQSTTKVLSALGDWMMNLGRSASIVEQFNSKLAETTQLEKNLAQAQLNPRGRDSIIADMARRLDAGKQDLDQLRSRMQFEAAATYARSRSAVVERKAIDDQIEADKKAASTKRSAAAAATSAARDAAREQELQNNAIAEAAGLTADFAEKWARLNATFKDGNKVYADGETGYQKLAAAQAVLLAQQPAMKKAADEEAASIKAAQKVATERAAMRAAEQKAIDEFSDKEDARRSAEVKAAGDALAAAQLEYDQHGKTRSQIAEVTLQRLRDKQTAFEVGSANYQAVQREIDAQTQLVGILRRGEIRAAAEESAKENRAAWDDFAQDINRSLTDSLYRAFESGEGFASAFFNSLKNTAKTTVIKIGVQAVSQGVTGLASQALGVGSSFNNAAGFYSAATGYSSGINTAASLLGAGSTAGAAVGSLGYANAVGALGGDSLGALIAANGSWGGVPIAAPGMVGGAGAAAGGGSTLMSSLSAAGPYIAAALAVYLTASKYTKGETRAGGQYGLGSTPNGTYGSSASFLSGPSGGQIEGDQVTGAINSTAAGINTLFKQLGSSLRVSGLQGGLESSDKGRGGVYFGGTLNSGATFGELGLGGGRSNYDGTLYETTSATSLDSATALKNFSTDLMQGTIQALQTAADIPKNVAEMLKGVDAEALSTEAAGALIANVSAMAEFNAAAKAMPFPQLRDLSFEAANGIIQLVGGMDALGNQLGTYYQAFYTEAERQQQAITNLQGVFDGLGLTMPNLAQSGEAARAQFRQLVEAQDLNTESGRAAYAALLGVSGAFAELTPIGLEVSATVDQVTGEIKALSQVMVDLGRENTSLQDQIDRLTLSQAEYRAKQIDGYTAEERALAQANFALEDRIAGLQAEAAMKQQLAGLETQLLQLEGNTAEIRRRELDALPPAARAIQEMIYARTDEMAVAQAAAQQRQALNDQLAGLERQLLELQGNTAEIRRRELAALPAEARAIQELIFARTDEVAAANAANAAIQQAAQRADAILQQRNGLETQWLQLIGDTTTLRARELAAIDPSNRALQEAIWARQDQTAADQAAAAAAAESARAAEAAAQAQIQSAQEAARAIEQVLQQVAAERLGLTKRLLQLQGDTAALREMELAELDPTNRALQLQIWALEDQQAALNTATSAQGSYTNAVADSSDTLLAAGRNIAEFFAKLRGTSAGTTSPGAQLASAKAQFEAQFALAKGGNSEALSGITGYAERYIEAIRATAGSALDVQRLIGILEGRLTGLTGGALVSSVAPQVAAVPMAAAGESSANALMAAPVGFSLSPAGGGGPSDVAMVGELRALRTEVQNLRRESQATAVNTGRTARLFDRIERDGLGIRNVPGEVIEVAA